MDNYLFAHLADSEQYYHLFGVVPTDEFKSNSVLSALFWSLYILKKTKQKQTNRIPQKTTPKQQPLQLLDIYIS